MSLDQIVYKPTVARIGDVQCSENGLQRFRLTRDDLEVIIGVIPDGNDGASQYLLHVLVIADEAMTPELGPVELKLATSHAGNSESNHEVQVFVLRPARDTPRVGSGPMHGRPPSRTWMHEFGIAPDLDPRVHTGLSLSVSVEYRDQDGEHHQLNLLVPLAPRKVTIPTSVV